MKEIPLLFSTPMVQALLSGRKTQTRRIMKPQIKPCNHSRYTEAEWKDKPTEWSEAALKIGRAYCSLCGNGTGYSNDFGGIKCRYGKPGDLLWVREKWYSVEREGQGIGNQFIVFEDEWNDNEPNESAPLRPTEKFYRWGCHPSIHLPKYAARIWLKKTATKVERTCDISREDAIAEGLACITKDDGRTWKYGIPDLDGLPGTYNTGWQWNEWEIDPVEAFKKLWCKINGAETWNSWVWVNTFEVMSITGKPELVTEKENNV